MFQNYDFKLEYIVGGEKKISAGYDHADYSVEVKEDGKHLKFVLRPKKEIELVNAYLVGDYAYTDDDRVFVNGYQSWTTTREYRKGDVQPGLNRLGNVFPVTVLLKLFGDYKFQKYSKKPGIFHSYSYTYVNTNGTVKLIGTTTERTGYTVFHHDMNVNKMIVQKDVEGVTIKDDYDIFDLFVTDGGYEEVFDDYFGFLNFPKPRLDHMSGYTSWYNYYGNITEEQILRDLDGLTKAGDAANIFQIDDGYQSKVGDWVENEKFPNGMRSIVDKIHEKGYLAGLWMAPFNATFDSQVNKKHPEWMIRNKNGRKQLGVIGWGGGWTMDFYIPECAAYIKNFFKRVVEEWGFDMVKLDFLYSVCQTPRHNKSRGQIMTEAMEFLRECIGEKTYLLGCGVPLFPAFGACDMCRISCDVSKTLKVNILDRNGNQEIPSARNAMNNSIFRRHLNGRVWVNDPDVFYLRDNNLKGIDPHYYGTSKLNLTDEQKQLIGEVNNMCGDVLFVSDNVGGYNEKQLADVKKFFRKTTRKVLDAYYTGDHTIAIEYADGDKKYRLTYHDITGENKTEEI